MDSVKPSALNTPHKTKFARTIAKVLHLRAAAGIAPADGISKPKKPPRYRSAEPSVEDNEERAANEALLAKLFAAVSAVKSGYAQLQLAQTPYDPDGIQSADDAVVAELKSLSELKRCYLKKQYFDPSPEISLIKAEVQEQKSLLKTYETTAKKLEYQASLKESELASLREKLEELNNRNRLFEKRLNQSGQLLTVLDNLHLSGLNPTHFSVVLRHAAKSIRGFARVVTDGMRSAGWDFDAAARAIQPEANFWREEHRCFAIESFVSREMFEGFCFPNFHGLKENRPPTEEERRRRREKSFARFMELKSARTRDYLVLKPRSAFASFCRIKYSKLVHPKMELSFSGCLDARSHVLAGEFSSVEFSDFFTSFAEMAKRVWLLHCLAFAFDPEASIFRVQRGCRFSEVYMESIVEEVFPPNSPASSSSLDNNNSNVMVVSDSQVAFTVIPGFRIGKTVIQSKVYLSQTVLDRR